MKPKDFCRFETAFEDWKRWLAGINTCDGNFDICRFLELLFNTPYDCLDTCVDCIPCTDPGDQKPLSCIEEERLLKRKQHQLNVSMDTPFAFLNQVNNVFCFDDYCQKNDFNNRLLLRNRETIKEKAKETTAPDTIAATKEPVKPKAIIKEKKEEEVAPVKESKPEVLRTINVQQKAKIVNARFKKYKAEIAGIIEHTGGNPLAIKTDRFVSSQQADVEKLDTLTAEILENQKQSVKGAKSLNKTQQSHLLRAAVCFYLDKVSFNGKDKEAYRQLNKVMARLKKAAIDPHIVYKYWDEEEVASVEPGADIDFIKKIVTDSKK